MKPQQKKRQKKGEYDGYEYAPVLDPTHAPPKTRGVRKRGSGKSAAEEKGEQPAPQIRPRHTMYEAPTTSQAPAAAASEEQAEERRVVPPRQEGIDHAGA
jgi:hypothetical protein